MNLYSHVAPALQKDGVDKMEAVLNPTQNAAAASVATKHPCRPSTKL
jgi:hypothetical protein